MSKKSKVRIDTRDKSTNTSVEFHFEKPYHSNAYEINIWHHKASPILDSNGNIPYKQYRRSIHLQNQLCFHCSFPISKSHYYSMF